MNTRRADPWDLALIVAGLFILKYLILAPFYVVFVVIVIPLTVLSWIVGWSPPPVPWGDVLASWFFAGVYVALWYRKGLPPKFTPPWVKDLAGRFLGSGAGVASMAMERFGGKDKLAVPSRAPTAHNEAVEELMHDLLSYQPANQGWLAEVSSSLREQARTGRLQANLERIVAILEQEKQRMQHLTEINRLSGQLSQAGLAADVEAKRIALERLKLEQEAQRLAAEMDELLGLKAKERHLKEKEIELRVAQVERELEELRRKPEPPPAPPAREPQPQETPEQYAARRADMLIKYAAEIKRIRNSVDDPELAENLVDRFLIDVMRREDR